MVVPHNGAGMLVPLVGIFSALFMNVFSFRVLGVDYYEKHRWPKLAVFILGAVLCVVSGILLKMIRKRDARKGWKPTSLEAGLDRPDDLAFDGSRDHLFYIPLQYWSIAYVIGAIIYVAKSS